jgi:hypothetical protein
MSRVHLHRLTSDASNRSAAARFSFEKRIGPGWWILESLRVNGHGRSQYSLRIIRDTSTAIRTGMSGSASFQSVREIFLSGEKRVERTLCTFVQY